MKRELSRRATLFALVLGGMAPVAAIPAQDRSPTDRSLGASLLAVSLPGPSVPRLRRPDSTKSESVVRFEATYGRAFTGGQIGGVQPMVVLGIRGEQQKRDSDGNYEGGPNAVGGGRVGIRAGERAEEQPISAIELYVGVRNITIRKPSLPDVGIDLVAGWGNIGVDTRGSIGLRVPIEMVSETKHGRLTVFAAPTIAWGHIRVRPCEDRGPDDNCGDLGIQAVLGRRRFLIAGGASLSVLPARLSVVAGVQRLFARQEETRVWIGTVWTP